MELMNWWGPTQAVEKHVFNSMSIKKKNHIKTPMETCEVTVQFYLHFQKKIKKKHRKMVGAEAERAKKRPEDTSKNWLLSKKQWLLSSLTVLVEKELVVLKPELYLSNWELKVLMHWRTLAILNWTWCKGGMDSTPN